MILKRIHARNRDKARMFVPKMVKNGFTVKIPHKEHKCLIIANRKKREETASHCLTSYQHYVEIVEQKNAQN